LYDLVLPKGVEQVDIPFEYENDFIVVEVLFNGTLPLRFIFDTGAEHTILTKKAVTDLFQVQYDRKFTIYGSDLSSVLYAYLARGITLKLNRLIATNRNILVLEEDYFRFQEFAGVNVQGILGSDLFRRFVVKINFRRQIISFIDPSSFEPPGNAYETVDIELERHKPYIHTDITVSGDQNSVPARLLIDTGASLSLLLYTNTDLNITLPPKVIRTNIGMGLGGYIQGALGRVEEVEFSPFELNGVVTSFQELQLDMDTLRLAERHGILGNHILKRFTIYLDYIEGVMYLKPNRNFRKKFTYDRSGISLTASGPALNEFTVFNVVEGSPADEAGVLVGDQIKRLNGWPVFFSSLGDLTRKLRARKGKRIRLVIEREDEILKLEFRLRDLI
jgi:hypothetical protein